MAGVSLTLDIQDEALRGAFARLIRITGNPRPALEEIGAALVSTTSQRFVDSRDPSGHKWQKLARSTVLARLRRNNGGTVIKPLVDHRILSGSINWRVEGDSVLVRTGKSKYAAIHQFGGKAGRGHKVSIPARPYLGLSEADGREVQDILARRIEAAL